MTQRAKASQMSAARRRKLARTMMEPSSAEDVVDAIATFARRSDAQVYVERRGDGFRWSPVGSGPYAVTREIARLLDLDYHSLIVGCAAVKAASVAAPEGPQMPEPAAWLFIAPSAHKNAVMTALASLTAADRPPHTRSRAGA